MVQHELKSDGANVIVLLLQLFSLLCAHFLLSF